MAAEQMLYFRGSQNQNDHEDIWDDRALIRAYDKAVALAKEGISSKQKEMESGSEKESDKKKKNHKNKKKDSKQKSRKWKVGETCKALYSGDGLSYTAVIESIDVDQDSCVVLFTGYGNRETVSISDLTTTNKRQLKGKSPTGAKYDHEQAYNSNTLSESESPSRRQSTCGFKPNQDSTPWPFPPPRSPAASGHFPPYCGPTPPPQWPGFNYPPYNSWERFNFPNIPPLPPPPIPPLQVDSPDDVLASTLISWYMSGYHTGFYQAIKQYRNLEHARNTPPFKKNRSSSKK